MGAPRLLGVAKRPAVERADERGAGTAGVDPARELGSGVFALFTHEQVDHRWAEQ